MQLRLTASRRRGLRVRTARTLPASGKKGVALRAQPSGAGGPKPPAYAVWTNGVLQRSGGAQARLFCFPFAGGGASFFWPWIASLGPAVELWALQLPGRESRWGETPYQRIEPLVKRLADDLEPLLQPPFAFFGHSMGAFILFELARELRRRGRKGPSLLLVSAARAPHTPNQDEPINGLSDAQLIERLRRLDGIPEPLFEHVDVLQLMLPVLRADLTLCDTYECAEEGPLDCALTVFGGVADQKAPRELLEAWRYQTTGRFALRMFPGGHFYLGAARSQLLEAIAAEMKQILPGGGA